MAERVDGKYSPAQTNELLSAEKVVFTGNRFQRRRDAKQHLEVREKIIWQRKLDTQVAKLNETSNDWNKTVRGANHDVAEVVFHSEPVVYSYLQARRDLRKFLDQAQGVNLRNKFCDPKFLNQLDDQDVFSVKLGRKTFREGISLMDIEQMKLDRSSEQAISLEDVARINSIFRLRFDPRLLLHLRKPVTEDNKESIIRQSVIYLATQKKVRPELKLAIPLALAPLHERLIHYFDYYTKIIANTSFDEETDFNLNRILIYYYPWLDQALGCYIPARLGITPASAIKLYKYRTQASSVPFLYWTLIIRSLNSNSSRAYRDNILAADLESLIHPDDRADQNAADKLLVLTDIENKTDDQLVEANYRAESLLEKFGLYHKSLYSDVTNSKDQRLEVNLNAESTLNKITVAFQYKDTAMLVLHFHDGQTRLLLELGKDINNDQKYALYGIPPKLLQNYPHIVPSIIIEILPPLLKQLRLMHPAIEDISKKAQKPVPIIFPSPKTAEHQQQGVRERAKAVKPKPIRRFITPLQRVLAEPKLNEPTRQQKKFIVFFSKSKIEQSLPKNTPLEVIDQIVRELRNFELGRTTLADKVRVSEGVWEIKSKRYRIFLRHIDGRFYAFASAGRRSMEDRLFRGIR